MCAVYYRDAVVPLIWLPQNWTGVGLSNILDYTTAPTLTQVHTNNSLFLPLHLNCPTNQFTIWISVLDISFRMHSYKPLTQH
jgi:hypothetical protein